MKIPYAEYEAIKAVRRSDLEALRRNPAYMRHRQANPVSSEAMAFGSALHCAALEPAEFDRLYAVAPKVDRRTGAGKQAWAEFVEQAGTRTVLSQDDGDRIGGIIAAIRCHGTANKILMGEGAIEESLTWDDAGTACKARLDKVCNKLGAVVDLKTTRDASPEEFQRSVLRYGYHRQAAWYLRAARENGMDVSGFLFVAVESEPPHGVAVYSIDAAAIAQGAAEIDRLMATYRECLEADTWPGYPDRIMDISIPKWGFSAVPFEGEPKF
jgi:exodeoxyribonuclease VIII